MAIEARRGCGYRKVGALYLCGPQPSFACGRMPLPTDQPLFRNLKQLTFGAVLGPSQDIRCKRLPATGYTLTVDADGGCPDFCWAKWPVKDLDKTVGMLWVGETDYTPESFTAEAVEMGLSKRIPGIPKWLELGKTQIFLAHISAYRYNRCLRCGMDEEGQRVQAVCLEAKDGKHDSWGPGLFLGFIPQAVECLVECSKMEEEWVVRLLQRGVTIIEIPDGDPDHTDRVAKEERHDGPDRGTQRRPGHGGTGRGL